MFASVNFQQLENKSYANGQGKTFTNIMPNYCKISNKSWLTKDYFREVGM